MNELVSTNINNKLGQLFVIVHHLGPIYYSLALFYNYFVLNNTGRPFLFLCPETMTVSLISFWITYASLKLLYVMYVWYLAVGLDLLWYVLLFTSVSFYLHCFMYVSYLLVCSTVWPFILTHFPLEYPYIFPLLICLSISSRRRKERRAKYIGVKSTRNFTHPRFAMSLCPHDFIDFER